MGNESSFEARGQDLDSAAANIGYFDHSFNCALKVIEPNNVPAHVPSSNFQTRQKDKLKLQFGGDARICELCCRMDSMALSEETGETLSLQRRELLNLRFDSLVKIIWDHSSSSSKFVTKGGVVVLDCEDSLELERELQQRLKFVQRRALQQQRVIQPTAPFEYMGMYASTKPKPFQRKRASLSQTSQGKLPPLAQMRALALSSHQGSGKPVAGALSRRMALFREHIHHGIQTFRLKKLTGLLGDALLF